MTNSIFATKRMHFRQFELSDLDRLAAISADVEGSKYVGDGQPLSREQTAQWISNSRDNVARYGYGTGAVLDNQSGELIGWAGVARPGDGTEEIIYGFDRGYWGQGRGTELLAGIIKWADVTLGLGELRATVHCDNAASIRMLVQRGFELVDACYEGDDESHLYRLHINGESS